MNEKSKKRSKKKAQDKTLKRLNEVFHEHKYAPPVSLNEEDWFEKTCIECQFKVKFEKL